jgi:hypothetical protein
MYFRAEFAAATCDLTFQMEAVRRLADASVPGFAWCKLECKLPRDLDFDWADEETFPMIASGPNGGVIAISPQEPVGNQRIDTYTTQLTRIHSYNDLPNFGHSIPNFFVAPDDRLFVITECLEFISYFNGREVSRFTLPGLDGYRFAAAGFCDDGFALLATRDAKVHLFWSAYFKDPEPMGDDFDLAAQSDPVLKVIPPDMTEDGKPIAFLVVDGALSVFSASRGLIPTAIQHVVSFAFSPDYERVAFLLESREWIVCSSSLGEIPPPSSILDPPLWTRIAWLDAECAVFASDDEILLIALRDQRTIVNEKDCLTRPFSLQSRSSCLVIDADGLWKIELSLNMPRDVQELVEASLEKNATLVYELIDGGHLEAVITDYLNIAMGLDDPEDQQVFMRAVGFARAFVTSACSDAIGQAIQYLKLSITFAESFGVYVKPCDCRDLSLTNLLLRICNRGSFSLAFDIAQTFKMCGVEADMSELMTAWISVAADRYRLICQKLASNFDAAAILAKLDDMRIPTDPIVRNMPKGRHPIVPSSMTRGPAASVIDAAKLSNDPTLLIKVIKKRPPVRCNDTIPFRVLMKYQGYVTEPPPPGDVELSTLVEYHVRFCLFYCAVDPTGHIIQRCNTLGTSLDGDRLKKDSLAKRLRSLVDFVKATADVSDRWDGHPQDDGVLNCFLELVPHRIEADQVQASCAKLGIPEEQVWASWARERAADSELRNFAHTDTFRALLNCMLRPHPRRPGR